MRYVDCCKSTRKNKKCTRKDGKHFSLQRRFTKKKCIKGPVKGFTMRASCAPYKFCKQKGGARKTRKLLPKLRKISYKNKKHHYKLKDPFSKRKLAIHEGVNREAKKTGKTKKKAAIAKKGRFNILRIYRKNKKIKECNTITHDMRYMDRKYGLGKTKNICGQKGGTYNFPPDRPDSTFTNIDDLKLILSFYSPHNNNKIIIKSYTGDEDEHQLQPELASDTHILIVGADYGIPFFLFQGGGFEIKPKGVDNYLTYVPPQQQGGSRKKKGGKLDKSILNDELQVCSKDPMTGFTRDGYCRTNSNDSGSHLVCAKMDQQFLDYTKSQGNDLSSVVKDGENWCLCQDRWLQAHKVKKAPKVIKSATNSMIRDEVKSAIGQKGGGFIKVFSIFNDEFPEPISTDANGNQVKTMAWYGILVTPLISGMAKMYMDPDFYNYFKWHPDKNEREYKRRVIKKILIALRNNLHQKNDKGEAYFGKKNKFNIEQANFVLTHLKERNKVLKKIIAPKTEQYISRLSPIEELQEEKGAFSGGKRRRKTRKKRGGNDPPWQRETLQPNPETFDDIGYFYDCRPIPGRSQNKSKYRENMIITGDRDGNQLMLPDKWKIIRMNDSQTYDPQLQLVDMREREGLRGMAAFHRRAQDLCNRGYKPWERNDAKTGAGRKKKTRKKRGGWGRDWNVDSKGKPYYDCPNKHEGDWRYKEGIVISNVDAVISPLEAQEVEIKEMARSNRGDPTLVFNHTINPHEHDSRRPADEMCLEGFKPLKKNNDKIGAGRKKKTRKKRGGVNRLTTELPINTPQDIKNLVRDYFTDTQKIQLGNALRSLRSKDPRPTEQQLINFIVTIVERRRLLWEQQQQQQGGSRKKRGGTKQCNICHNSHPQEDIIGCEHKKPDGSPLKTNWYHKECLKEYWKMDNVPCTNDPLMGSVTNLINCDTPSKTFINKNLDKPNCDDMHQYGMEGAWGIWKGDYNDSNLPSKLEDIYDEQYVTWIRRGWGENHNDIIMYNDNEEPFRYDEYGQEKKLPRKNNHTGGRRKKKTRKKKKQFLYNPNDPSKSFDVYIDKNPKDTIPIKYTTVKDVKDTIKKLERLYKTKKYPHKRIWQVGMIMKVRLEAMLKHKTKKYPNAKKVKQRFNLANKYFKFLGKRTKKKDFKSRKAMTFKF